MKILGNPCAVSCIEFYARLLKETAYFTGSTKAAWPKDFWLFCVPWNNQQLEPAIIYSFLLLFI